MSNELKKFKESQAEEFKFIKEMNLFVKLLAITNELRTVAKNLTVQQTAKSSYKAVSERDILDAVKPLELKYRVYSYPVARKVLESNLLESESEYQGKVTKKTTFMTRMETTYRFVNIDKPEEYIETTVFSEGIDAQDKGSGKAMTYADKYALMKAYKISTGDDPDQTASVDTNYKKAKKRTYREMLIDKLHALGIDINEFAKEYRLSPSTTEERYQELLEGLEIDYGN